MRRLTVTAVMMLFLVLFLALAGGVLAAPEPAPVSQACLPSQSTIENFAEALDLHADAFDEDDWILEVQYKELNYRIQINRFRPGLNGVISLDYLIYDCGYDVDDLEAYYDDDTFDILFDVYSETERTAECNEGGLMLYEYDLVYEDEDYVSRFWVVEYSDTRVYDLQMTYPEDEADLLDEMSEALFPELWRCKR